ncbi:MAG: hypothetical protein ACRDOJ_05060 [Nocardioidaceae bacterium]
MTTALTPAEAIAQAAVTAWAQDEYIDAARRAAVREAVDLIVGRTPDGEALEGLLAVQGDVQLACWSLFHETTRLATVSDSTITNGDALLAYHRCLGEQEQFDAAAVVAQILARSSQ